MRLTANHMVWVLSKSSDTNRADEGALELLVCLEKPIRKQPSQPSSSFYSKSRISWPWSANCLQ